MVSWIAISLLYNYYTSLGFTLSALLHSDGHGTGKLTMGADATTVICHRYTPHNELRRLASGADIVITATGKHNRTKSFNKKN